MDISFIQWAFQFGFAAAVAAFFIYWITNYLKHKLDRIEDRINLIREEIKVRLEEIRGLLKEILEELRRK